MASRSGLDYADGTQDLDDLDGQTHTVRLALTVQNRDTGIVEQTFTDEVLTFTVGGDGDDFTLTLDGETLTFVDGRATPADGSQTNGFLSARDSFLSDGLQFVKIISLLGSPAFNGRIDSEVGFFSTGFETNPDSDAITTGSTTFSGIIDGEIANAGNAPFTGEFTLNADFSSGTVDGNLSLTGFETEVGEGDIDFDINSTAITGNGFAGDMTLMECSFASCTSDSEIGGVFYGPNAQEVAGVLSIDVTATNDAGQSDQVITKGAFGGTSNAED